MVYFPLDKIFLVSLHFLIYSVFLLNAVMDHLDHSNNDTSPVSPLKLFFAVDATFSFLPAGCFSALCNYNVCVWRQVKKTVMIYKLENHKEVSQ